MGYASETACWHPETRERADHSHPFLLALALTEGSVEGTEPRLETPVDQCEAELCIEGDGFWHRPDGKGHGAKVVNHAGCRS
jgi:hypothetical protein